jgi:hypothetical protein
VPRIPDGNPKPTLPTNRFLNNFRIADNPPAAPAPAMILIIPSVIILAFVAALIARCHFAVAARYLS